MTRRSLFLLSLVGLLVAGFLFYALPDPTSDLTDMDGEEGGLSRSTEVAQATQPEGDALPEPASSVEVERVEPPPSSATSERVEAATFRLPDDSLWVTGRVILPAETPPGEKLSVTARGRRFGKAKDAPRERTTEVDHNGEFRLPFSESTKRGWLSIEADYLYLPKKIRIEPRKVEGPVQIEPRLGGRVTGRVLLPAGIQPNAETLGGASVRLWAWNDGESVQRSAKVEPDGTFVIAAVPAGSDYQINVETARYTDGSLAAQTVRRGEDTLVEIELKRGVRLEGSITDEAGQLIRGTDIQVKVTSGVDGNTSSTIRTLPLDKDGEFDVAGLTAGQIVLTVKAPGCMILEEDLGKLEDGDERLGIELVPSAGTFLTGSVHWPDGMTAKGARVHVVQASPDGGFDWEGREFSATTDEEGAFRIDGLQQRDIIVEASARRPMTEGAGKEDNKRKKSRGPLLTARTEDASPGTAGLRLTLSEGMTFSGRVIDDRGQPVERFSIEAQPRRDDDDSYRTWEDRKQRNFSDEAGEFEMSGLDEGPWKVRAIERSGGVSAWVEVKLPGASPVELKTPRGTKLSGVVKTPHGETVPDAWVEFTELRENRFLNRVRSRNQRERTDERGHFQFERTPPGKLSLSADADGWAASESLVLELNPGEEREELLLVLRTPAILTGEIHPRAAPIANRQIQIWGENFSTRASTDDGGKFRVEGMPPGELRVRLQPYDNPEDTHQSLRDAQSDQVKIEVLEAGTVHVVLGAPAQDPIKIVGKVTLGGAPAAGFSVSCRGNDYNTATDADSSGNYQLEVDGPGNYNFYVVRGEASYSYYHKVEAGAQQRVDIEIPTASLSGELIGFDGEPAANLHLTMTLLNGDKNQRGSKYRQTKSDAEGTFQFQFLHPGEYVLRVGWGNAWGNDEGRYAIHIIDDIVLGVGEERTGLRVPLDRGGKITGIVTCPDGSPAMNASIYITDSKGRELAWWGMASTDETGRFTCEGIPAGKVGVRAQVGPGVAPVEEGGAASNEGGEGSTTANASAGGTTEVSIVLSGC